MKLFDIIKSWFDNSEQNKLDHFNLEQIEKVISSLKAEPILKFMQQQCEEFLKNVTISFRDKSKTEKKFYVINGVSGSGKTNFLHEYLQDYLIAIGAIKNRQERITKIANRDLSNKKLQVQEIDDIINRRVKSSKDGMLIIDEFTVRNKNAEVIANLIKQLYSRNDFNDTAVVLMGEYRNNSTFINTYNLENIFPNEFRLNFYTPSFNQITDIFEAYAKREGDFTVTEKAKSSLVFYFFKLQLIKDTKAGLDRQGTMSFLYEEKYYVYTSEMFPIYKDLIAIKGSNKLIDQPDVLMANSYKRLLNDLDSLQKYFR